MVAISPGRVQVNGPLGELSQDVPARMRQMESQMMMRSYEGFLK